MPVVMKNLGYPLPGMPKPEAEGQYLKDMDFEAHDGRGMLSMTSDIDKAKRFGDFVEAMDFCKRVPANHPIRGSDLQPNRPLTAFNWEFVTV
jgi:hypothetical protein